VSGEQIPNFTFEYRSASSRRQPLQSLRVMAQTTIRSSPPIEESEEVIRTSSRVRALTAFVSKKIGHDSD
jgi:hypothetical protein